MEETVNRAWDKRIERCKETTRHIWKQLSQFIFKVTLFLKKKSKGAKGPKRTKSFLTNLPPVYALTQHSPNLCHALFFWITSTTIPVTPSFFLVTHYSIFFHVYTFLFMVKWDYWGILCRTLYAAMLRFCEDSPKQESSKGSRSNSFTEIHQNTSIPKSFGLFHAYVLIYDKCGSFRLRE